MNNDLELLLRLQVIDYDIGELERSKEYLPDMIENLNREIEEAKAKLAEAKLSLEETRVRQKQLELEIKTHESHLQKYQQQMMSIKTNKEYDALVAEIDSVKLGMSNSETELIQAIERAETLEKEIVELGEKSAQVEENNTRQLQILQEKIDSIGETMSSKESDRGAIVSSMPRSTLSVYERVRRGKGGQAVVVVKKRACGACFKALTPKKIQDVKRGDRVFTCDHCGAIIYWDDSVSA
ncbi:MAG: C4-type zinc ribbon domain-containing protein [candidate division Zixibacteria bacterium]|jgi:predicted  nucleic acid-binding Zn-ribbon protein|nr:C4-type zinc ribbon domain-containing protein [candidate division Zixibacteria bacterium]